MGEQAQLLQAFGDFEWVWGKRGEPIQCGAAVGVEAQMLAVGDVAHAVSVIWDGGAGEVKSPAVFGEHDLDGIRIGDLFPGAGRPERAYLRIDARAGKGARSEAMCAGRSMGSSP